MKETIEKIGESLEFISIAEPKFKTNTLELVFMVPVSKEKNAAYALAMSLLTYSCKDYPGYAELTKKLHAMYGASLNYGISKRGDVLQLSVEASVIDNRYVPEGTDLLAELTDLLLGCLFAPNAENGAFSDREFRIQKQDLLDAIEAEINNKRSYAMTRAARTAFEGEPFAAPLYGEKEDVEALDPAAVYAAYEELLRTAVIRIYHVGPAAAPMLADRFRTAFADVARCPVAVAFHAPSPCKAETVRVNDPMPVNQSKLVIVCKGTAPKPFAMNLMSTMFGAAPFSMLFMNVREKMSLCYYCASRVIAGKKALFIDSGVELENAEKACEAILAQLDAVRQGDFDDELLADAKHSMLNQLRGIGDTPSSCISWSHRQFCNGESHTIDELADIYEAMTRQDMMDAANALQVDTIYLMQQEVQHA
ncbi:MAG: insulinase family protein [Ruminococcus sp.]|nr:insulinase family protein [Ruminococcus sp.]